mgnify:FL=1|tara:strand:+ start:217 stop:438 length:222 start_codon:yes stop_codon:yes gene_type:complete
MELDARKAKIKFQKELNRYRKQLAKFGSFNADASDLDSSNHADLHRLSWELFLFAEEILWDDYERDAFINKTN